MRGFSSIFSALYKLTQLYFQEVTFTFYLINTRDSDFFSINFTISALQTILKIEVENDTSEFNVAFAVSPLFKRAQTKFDRLIIMERLRDRV